MIAYADVAEKIWQASNRPPCWVRAQIVLTDRWLWTLEELNMRDEKASFEQRDDLQRYAFETLGATDYRLSETGKKRKPLSRLSREPSDMLDLVFDLQEGLLVEGGYRSAEEGEEEAE